VTVTSWYKRLGEGLSRTREQLGGSLNVLLRRGPVLDNGFWDELEEALILADMGAQASSEMVERLREAAVREALPDAAAVIRRLADEIAAELTIPGDDPFDSGLRASSW